jgi:predicted GTPase
VEVICILGVTGHGKSALASTLSCTKDFFVSSGGTDSETSSVKGLATYFRNDRNQKELPCIILDTPGLGDSKMRDTEHIAGIVKSLKTIGFVDTFLITLNSEEPRFNE